jgi:hypothetical protein
LSDNASRLVVLHGLVALSAMALSACTTVGSHTKEHATVDFGPAATLRVCLLKNESVPAERADELIAAVNKEFEPYAIEVVVPWVRPWTRPGFEYEAITDEIDSHLLEAPCDRLVGLVDRNAGDFLWGLLMPEVLGAVEPATHTHGFVVAGYGSPNQIFLPPTQVAVHEFYHLLGCPHGLTLTKCYHVIAEIKAKSVPDADFFPGVTAKGEYLTTRESVNAVLQTGIARKRNAKGEGGGEGTPKTGDAPSASGSPDPVSEASRQAAP